MRGELGVGAKLTAFFVVLLGTFGTAYAVGERAPGHEHSSDDSHSHSHDDTQSSVASPGFEDGDHRLVTESIKGADGSPRVATFHLETTDGARVTEFVEAHGALLHVIVVRPDLSDFQHVHPDIAEDGSWQVELDDPGLWHIVFESTPADAAAPVVVSANLDDEQPVDEVPLPDPDDDVTIDGLRVVRDGLNFTVTSDDGSPAAGLEPYLGQPAHLVALRQGDLAYSHLHPQGAHDAHDTHGDESGMFMFGTDLPDAGTYRLFLQFGHDGEVLTVPFTVVQEAAP